MLSESRRLAPQGEGASPSVSGGLESIIWVTLATFVVYAVGTCGVSTGLNCHTQFALQLLKGSLALGQNLGTTEVARAHGQVFMVYGPGPSLLLLPFVAIFGATVNQTLASALFGAIAVGLWWGFLGKFGVSTASRRWLTVLFAVGTPFAYSAAYNGNNWFITASTGVLFLMGALYAQACDRPGIAGFLAGMAPLCRYPMLLLAPAIGLFGAIAKAERWRDVRWNGRQLVAFAIGTAIPLGILSLYNWARFGSFTDEGYKALLATDPADDFGRKPEFGLQYLAHNLQHYLLTPPELVHHFPWVLPGQFGTSMLLTTPSYLLLLWANWRRPLNQVAIVACAAVQTVYWLYFTDGVVQFGMRYTVDYLPLVLLVVATSTAERFGRLAQVLTVLGVLIEIWGFATWRLMGWG
ncbi:MAG: hypothetical protein KGR26_05850 [Cyanobacteria bacterium REEB65]|nr:hypothetical protein [Cyanobacteria bacterium REEB65]